MIIDSPIISGSFAASGSLNQVGDITITGSLTVTGEINGTALTATSASYALTASHATNVPQTASFADSATSASYAVTASYISGSGGGVGFPFSGSAIITGSLLITELSGSGVRYLTTDNDGLIVAQTASAAIKQTQAVTSTAGQTSFNITNGYTTGLVDVFINGTKLSAAEFTDTSGTVITLATGSNDGDTVEFVKYFPASGVTNNALRQQTTFTASAGQTVFSASYTPGLLDIFYNGSRLSNNEYTANTGTYFTLATSSAADDILDVFVYSYQVGAFNGIGGTGVQNQVAYFGTTNAITSSNVITVSGGDAIITGSLLGTASNATTASFALTASSADNLLVRNTLTAQTLVVQTITSSVDFVTGSTRFGSILGNTHQFTGSVSMTGSLVVVGALTGSSAIFSSSIRANAPSTIYGATNQDAIQTIFTLGGQNASSQAKELYFRLTAGGTPAWTFQTAAVGTDTDINIYPNGTSGLKIAYAGTAIFSSSVGVGNVTPYSILSLPSGNGWNGGLSWNFTTNGAASKKWWINTDQIEFGDFRICTEKTQGGGSINNASTLNERFYINAAGNIGIGTTDPATTLTVYKTRLASFTTQTPNQLYLQSQGYTGDGYNTIDFGSTSYGVPLARIGVGVFGDGTYMTFGTSNAYATGITNTALTIGPTGNVGIGSGTSGSPNNKLLVQGGNIAKGTTFGYDGAVDNMIKYGAQQDINASGQQLDRWIGIDATVTAGAGSSNIMFFKVYSGGGSGSPRTAAFFNGDGGVYNFNNSTTWQQTSDIRIKDNIRPINDAIEKLCALKPSHFEYKNNLGKTKTGFIAQEFEEVFAGHVTENVPSGEFKQYFEEGEMMKSIDADLIPYLVKAIQEQQTLITELQEKLERNNII